MKKVLLDAHTHTVASGHAYSSLQEMAKAAADMGLEVLGITEHGPSVPGTCPTLYFKNMFVVPRQMYGVRLLMGCEINILDTKGCLDLTDEQIGWLDIAIAGVHAAWYQAGTKGENTQGLVNVIKNPKIHIISHPGDGSCELDFEPLVLDLGNVISDAVLPTLLLLYLSDARYRSGWPAYGIIRFQSLSARLRPDLDCNDCQAYGLLLTSHARPR